MGRARNRWSQLLGAAPFLPFAVSFALLKADVITSDPPSWVWLAMAVVDGTALFVAVPVLYLRASARQDEERRRRQASAGREGERSTTVRA